MNELNASHFNEFFAALYGYTPFPWQERLARQVCETGSWPQTIDVPTASGKTACIDIALFALAVNSERSARRVFFVVDRRVIVAEAYERANRISDKLQQAIGQEGVLGLVADRLTKLAGDKSARPIEAYELRGGIYRDDAWVRSPLQPAVIATTVDQIGSSLLFRAYGAGQHQWPIYAGMTGNDALIILDEAHCSKAFSQTLSRIERYRGSTWATAPLGRPFSFVEMTATPSRPIANNSESFRIDDSDRAHDVFRERLFAPKPTILIEPVAGRKDDFAKLADALVDQAEQLIANTKAKRVAIIVNRVRTAKLVRDRLDQKKLSQLLVIGRMRPYDRDKLNDQYASLKSGVARQANDPVRFVVSTQCLEVGADLDFDVLVTECASIDALLQRFGRLDRLGHFRQAKGRIVVGAWQIDPKKPDAIYGDSLAQTWSWLKQASETNCLNMGIESAPGEPQTVSQLLKKAGVEANALRMPSPEAPALLPSHIDTLVQTCPVPDPAPSIEPFLHGPDDRVADLQVIWRSDLDEAKPEQWHQIVSLCPPVSREAMPVQIAAFKRWINGSPRPDIEVSDLAGALQENDQEMERSDQPRRGLIWRGETNAYNETKDLVRASYDVRPGDTVILPASARGWEEFGHIPQNATIDIADLARYDLRRKVCLRLHPKLTEYWNPDIAKPGFLDSGSDEGCTSTEIFQQIVDIGPCLQPSLHLILKSVPKLARKQLTPYPDGKGFVIEGWFTQQTTIEQKPIALKHHATAVQRVSKCNASQLLLSAEFVDALEKAAWLHDHGKSDLRFQTWLRGGDELAARFAPEPLAKSGVLRLGKQVASGLPDGFRHELVSLIFAQNLSINSKHVDLILHLIASHHGRCRPFAPVVTDAQATCLEFDGMKVCQADLESKAPHRVDSGVTERFWTLTRQYGWWGLAYVESLLRLADWQASDQTDSEVMD